MSWRVNGQLSEYPFGGVGYGLVRALARWVLALFYRRIEVVGLEHIPESGPVIVRRNIRTPWSTDASCSRHRDRGSALPSLCASVSDRRAPSTALFGPMTMRPGWQAGSPGG